MHMLDSLAADHGCALCARWLVQPPERQGVAGGFQVGCVGCCARLVRSARPLKHAQLAMLAAIARHEGVPPKRDVLAALKALDEKLAATLAQPQTPARS